MSEFPLITIPLSHLITFLEGRRDWQGLTPAECRNLADQLRPVLSSAITYEQHFMASNRALVSAVDAFKSGTKPRFSADVIEFPTRPTDGGAA